MIVEQKKDAAYELIRAELEGKERCAGSCERFTTLGYGKPVALLRDGGRFQLRAADKTTSTTTSHILTHRPSA